MEFKFDKNRDGLVDIVNGTKTLVRGLGTTYRASTDWIKPKIDWIVDRAAFWTGSNALLSSAIFYGNQALGEKWQDFQYFLNDSSTSAEVAKLTALAVVYGAANYFTFKPLSKQIFKRKPKPSWPNHAKTWAILAAGYAAFVWGGVQQDVERFSREISKANTLSEYAQVIFNEANVRGANYYLSGQKTMEIADMAGKSLDSIADIANDFTGYFLEPKQSEKIREELARVKRERANPSFPYTDEISRFADQLTAQGMSITPEQLVYITRVVYFEGAHDSAFRNKNGTWNEEELRMGMEAIAHVMLNRYNFDKKYNGNAFSDKGDGSIFNVVFMNIDNNWQFTAIMDKPKYFYPSGKDESFDLYGQNGLHIAVSDMDPRHSQLAYEAVTSVLSGKSTVRTGGNGGALFYKNSGLADRYNKDWKARYGVKKSIQIGSHTFYIPDFEHEKWQRLTGTFDGGKVTLNYSTARNTS